MSPSGAGVMASAHGFVQQSLAISQVGLVGVLQGVGMVGHQSSWMLAMAYSIAILLAFTYISSFAELSLMMPRAGGLGSYTEVALGQLPALVATFSGYVAVNMFGVSAELLIFDNVLRDVLGLNTPQNLLGFSTLAVIAALNIRGTDVFSIVQNASTWIKAFLMSATIAIVVIMGKETTQDIPAGPVTSFSTSLSLFFWCFVAVEFACPLISETKNPNKTMPQSMFLGLFLLAILYGGYAFGALSVMNPDQMMSSTMPHLDYAKKIFGNYGPTVLVLFATAATVGLINGVVAGVSRMLYDMARNGQAFPFLAHKNAKHGTPDYAIMFVALLCGAPLILAGSNAETIMTLVAAASVCWLLAYIVAHLNVVVLRIRQPHIHRPYRSPWGLAPQLLGIAGMVLVIATTPPNVQWITGGVIGAVTIWSALWVKIIMRKKFFSPEPLDNFLTDLNT